MANHTVTIEIKGEEIINLLQKQFGVKFKSVRWDIEEHGHPDRGDYVRKVKKLIVNTDEIPINSEPKS
jgi:hypothetical protein